MLKLFLDHVNIDINARSNTGKTALMLACKNGHVGAVKLLLNHPRNKNIICNVQCDSPVFLARKYGHKDVVNLLLQYSEENQRLNSVDKALQKFFT